MEILFPGKGLSDLEPKSRQARGTTSRGKNARATDPVSLAVCGAQRAGHTRVAPDPLNGANRVHMLAEAVFDSPAHTYTALGDAVTVDWSTSTPTARECPGAIRDHLGNVYVVDGPTGVVKLNPDGVRQWKIALPSADRNSVVRAIAVDEALRVFVGVSSGGDVRKAKLWAYEQLEDNKTELLWEIEPGFFTESLWVEGLTLYAAQNDDSLWKSRVALYTGIGLNEPTLTKTFNAPYPINFGSVSPKDGSIFLSHEPNSSRGRDPRSPYTTADTVDWTPQANLDNYGLRVITYLDADDPDGHGNFAADLENGDVVDTIVDLTGQDRNAYARTGGGDTGGRLIKGAIAGHHVISFNGTSNSYTSDVPVTLDVAARNLNKTLVPVHSGAQFALFLLVRIPQSDALSAIFSQTMTTAANNRDRVIYGNATYSGGVANANGSMFVHEQSNTATPPSGRAASVGNVPLGGAFDGTGIALITYIFDGGYDDVALNPTLTTIRVNGHPIDRFRSRAAFDALSPSGLGIVVFSNGTVAATARFKGDFLTLFCIGDWYVGTATAPLVQQRLITVPTYPDAVWAANGNSECEQIEGWMMNAKGLAHLLPAGHYSYVEGTANVVAGNTVTVDGQTYTYASPITTTPYDVLVGANAAASLRNLHHAINGTGQRGVQYAASTPAAVGIWSPGVLETINSSAGGLPALLITTRNGAGTATYTTAEVGGFTVPASVAVSPSSLAGGGVNIGHYPHPFYYLRTPTAAGGAPSSTSGPSVGGALASPYGMLTKWDPVSGNVRNVLTSNFPNASNGYGIGVGGIGYGHVVLSDGSIVCTGPRQVTVASPAIVQDLVDIRRVADTENGFVVQIGVVADRGWQDDPGAQTYRWPRLDKDSFDNSYVPIHQAANGTSLKAYRRLGTNGAGSTAPLFTVSNITDDPRGYAVVVDPEVPDLPIGFVDPRHVRFYLFTERFSATNTVAVYALREISAAPTNVTPRVVRQVAIAGGNLYQVNPGAGATLLSANFVSPASRFLDWTTFKGVLYVTDGVNGKVYNGRNGTLGTWRALKGQIPAGFKLVERYCKRIFVAGLMNDRYGWKASAYDDATAWDEDPPGDSALAIAAISSDTSLLGGFGDPVTCMCPWKDDLMVFGGDKVVSLLRGDPAQGGRFDEVINGIGIAFGRARCFTPDGTFWFITNDGEMYRWRMDSMPQKLSRKIQRRLQATLDFSLARVEMHYDPIRRAIMVLQIPHGALNTTLQHWVYELDTDTLTFPDTYGHVDVTPTAVLLRDGEIPSDRQVWIGCGDGRVRYINPAQGSDDGVRIDSEVLFHLPEDDDTPLLTHFENLEVFLDKTAGGARYEFLGSDRPDSFGPALASGVLVPGRNRPPDVSFAVAWGAVLLAGRTDALEHWALARMNIDASRVQEAID